MGVTATQAHGGLVEAFDAVVDDRPDVDRHEVFRRLRAELPIFRSERLSAWVVSRYHEVFELNKKLGNLKGSKLVLCGVGPKLMELLKITRLDRILTVKPTQHEAVKVFDQI